MRRKWIGMMMAAALTLGLTACGGSPANDSAGDNPDSAGAANTDADTVTADGKVKITAYLARRKPETDRGLQRTERYDRSGNADSDKRLQRLPDADGHV